MEKNSQFKHTYSEKNNDNEIDLGNVFSFILRNKFLIASFGFISFFIACLYALNLKKIWEGQFQIVLNTDNSSRISSLNPALRNLIGAENNNNNLNTQVGILQSPSVLMPIYDLVNGENKKDLINKIPFYKWQSNLDIELESGTSILNIAYRDTNKEIILPALKKMSSIYQDYSGRIKQREEKLTKEYLTNQINLFREKSANSIKVAQNYAIDQNMIYLPNENLSNNSDSILNKESQKDIGEVDLYFGSIVNIENIRVAAANEIRTINLQIEKINELDPMDYENLQYFGSSIPALSEEGLAQNLKAIENELVSLRTKFTENDPSIIQLLEQKKLTINLLKSRAINYLKIAKLEAEAKMEAAMRPKGVLLKYRELRREAARDEKTLLSLENDLRILQLQQAKISDPWQLITQPTLLKNPVGPSSKNIAFMGLIAGSFLGVLLSLYKEKKSGKIYYLQELDNLISTPLLDRINKNEQFLNSKQINFLKEFLKNQNAKNIAFITLEEINISYLENLIKFLNNDASLNKKINFITSQNKLETCKNSEFTILFTSLGFSSITDIKALNNRFQLLEIDFKGFILLD